MNSLHLLLSLTLIAATHAIRAPARPTNPSSVTAPISGSPGRFGSPSASPFASLTPFPTPSAPASPSPLPSLSPLPFVPTVPPPGQQPSVVDGPCGPQKDAWDNAERKRKACELALQRDARRVREARKRWQDADKDLRGLENRVWGLEEERRVLRGRERALRAALAAGGGPGLVREIEKVREMIGRVRRGIRDGNREVRTQRRVVRERVRDVERLEERRKDMSEIVGSVKDIIDALRGKYLQCTTRRRSRSR